MATDKSEPRIGLIVKVGVLSVVTLGVLRVALDTYFDHEARAEQQRKIGEAKPDGLLNLRADEKARLGSGPMPIDKAMEQLAVRGRLGLGSEVTPKMSHDMAPLQGWVKMPAEVPPTMMAAADGGAEVAADGGGATVGDGGIPLSAGHERVLDRRHLEGGVAVGADAGAPKKKP
jgi:hypothetical protein